MEPTKGDGQLRASSAWRRVISSVAGDNALRRIDAIRHELRYGPPAAWGRWREQRLSSRKRRILAEWLESLSANPPEVLIGANVNRSDGIRNHLLGILRYSALNVAMSPPDEVMSDVGYHDLHTTFRDMIQTFPPTATLAVHSHVYPYYVEWCRRHSGSGPTWVHTYHPPYFMLDESTPMPPWQEEVNRWLFNDARHAHVRISVARWLQEYLADNHGISTEYVPNGVDVAFCDQGNPAAFEGGSVEEGFVLFVGRNDSVKNPAAFANLAQAMPEQRFVMLGHGLLPDDVSTLLGADCPDNLLALGERSRADVQNALAACAVLVVPSIREGLPTVVLEAMARGRSVVVSDDPGCLEAIAGGKYGFVFRQGDIADLIEKTEAALTDLERRSGARAHILAEYDWRVVAPRLDAIYRGDPPRK